MSIFRALAITSTVLLMGCTRTPEPAPPLTLIPPITHTKHLPSCCPPPEGSAPWIQEWRIGQAFGREGDFYRAITAFKRALILLPSEEERHRLYLQYDILLSYAMGGRWQDALDYYRQSDLNQASLTFTCRRDLLLLLQEIFLQTGEEEASVAIDPLLPTPDQEVNKISRPLELRRWQDVSLPTFRDSFATYRKDPQKAAMLQIFPGAGYLYVGQPKAALTSLFVNALSIWATISLAQHHQVAAACLVGTLEVGWYFGGIHGAALAAHQWNDRLGEQLGRPCLTQERYAPLFRLEYFF